MALSVMRKKESERQPGVPSKSDIEKRLALERDIKNKKAISNQPVISSYIPKAGDQERMNVTRDAYRADEAKLLNRAAGSKYAANAMENIVEPMVNVEAGIGIGQLAKNAIKSGLKSMSKRALGNSKLGMTAADFNEMYDKIPYKDNKILEANNALADFKARINTPEGQKRMADLGIIGDAKNRLNDIRLLQDNNNLAYYKGKGFMGNYIGLNKDIPNEFASSIARHEIEHGVQGSSPTKIDDLLSNLELRKTPESNLYESKKDLDPSMIRHYLKKRQNATNYFANGSEGREKSAFLAELQQHLVDKKLISHPYAVNEITPDLLKDAHFDNISGEGYPLRIFDIMKPTDNNYKILANGLNKMLTGTAAIVGADKLNSMNTK